MDVVVCPLSEIGSVVAQHRPGHVVSLLSAQEMVLLPADLMMPDRHLRLTLNDIAAPTEGLLAPALAHAEALAELAAACDRAAPIVVHCWAGISRSTAAAFILLCALDPDTDEAVTARALRAAAPFAQPNRLLVAHGDEVLGRGGRMTAAIEAMEPPALAFQGRPFALRTRGIVGSP